MTLLVNNALDGIAALLGTINPTGYLAPAGPLVYPRDWEEVDGAFAADFNRPIITLEYFAAREQEIRRKIMHTLLWDFTAVIWVYCWPASGEAAEMAEADEYLQVYGVEVAKKLVSDQTLGGAAQNIGERAALPSSLIKFWSGRIPQPGATNPAWYWGHRIELPVTVKISTDFGPM